MAGVLELTTINRLELILPATMSPTQQTPTAKKRDLQSLLFDKTPLWLADTLRAESQDKKRENKHEQAKKMIKMQGKDIANKGGAPGAVVTVKCDYRAVSELSVLFTR
jgi:nicotinamide riboside kinase